MNYKELVFTIISEEDYHQDLLINQLGGLGFDTFEETDFGFKAYIDAAKFNQEEIDDKLKEFHDSFSFSYEINLIPQKNWNEVWESNFEPIQINNLVYVRATFHQPKPEYKYEIIIDPKMAFGTGHHQTTSMMLAYLLEIDLKNKSVLDMGCGTGILAILASQLGAGTLTAIDNDEVCVESTVENAQLNHIQNINVILGSKEAIPDQQYDVILANINRNILVDQMSDYAKVLPSNGTILFSGFYESPDLDIINEAARECDLKYIDHKKKGDWVAAKFIK